MGEIQNERFQLGFNRYLKVDFHGSRVTSDANGIGEPQIGAVFGDAGGR